LLHSDSAYLVAGSQGLVFLVVHYIQERGDGYDCCHMHANLDGSVIDLSHGRSMALVLPYILDYNKIGNLRKYTRIAQAMGVNIEGLSMYEAE
jgi:alcohol dehydrogenase class IV